MMNNRYDYLKNIKSPTMSERGEMAGLQEQLYCKYKPNCLRDYLENMKKYLVSWISQETSFLSLNEKSPIFVDLNDFSNRYRYCQEDGNNIIRNIHEKIKLQDNVKGENIKTHSYLWVSQRKDGMVVTVGKSSFNEKNDKLNDDLFLRLSVSTGTANIILRSKFNDQIDSFNDYLVDYLSCGWIIPVPVDSEKEIGLLESELGDYLIQKEIPILNFYSHHY